MFSVHYDLNVEAFWPWQRSAGEQKRMTHSFSMTGFKTFILDIATVQVSPHFLEMNKWRIMVFTINFVSI